MFTDIKNALVNAERKLFTQFGTTLAALLLYGLLLAVFYAFVNTGERTALQVILSLLVFPLLFAVLFFSLQSLGVNYTSAGASAASLLRRAFGECWKLFVVSLPLCLVIGLAAYGLKKLEPEYLDYKWVETEWELRRALLIHFFRLFLTYFALPLMAMHLWIAAAREGIGATFRQYLRHLVRAFAPRSLAVYVLAWIINGVLAYLLLFGFKTQFGGPWVEVILLGLRIALAALLLFMAWFVSLGALAEVTAPNAEG